MSKNDRDDAGERAIGVLQDVADDMENGCVKSFTTIAELRPALEQEIGGDPKKIRVLDIIDEMNAALQKGGLCNSSLAKMLTLLFELGDITHDNFTNAILRESTPTDDVDEAILVIRVNRHEMRKLVAIDEGAGKFETAARKAIAEYPTGDRN